MAKNPSSTQINSLFVELKADRIGVLDRSGSPETQATSQDEVPA